MLALLINLLIIVLILGLVVYVINLLPIAAPWKNAALAIIAVIVIIYLLSLLAGRL